MAHGPRADLQALAGIAAMEDSHYLHAARAEFHRRLGELPEARAAHERAAGLAANPVERAWLLARREEVGP